MKWVEMVVAVYAEHNERFKTTFFEAKKSAFDSEKFFPCHRYGCMSLKSEI